MADAPYNLHPDVDAEISNALRWLRSAADSRPPEGEALHADHVDDVFDWIDRSIDALQGIVPPPPAGEEDE